MNRCQCGAGIEPHRFACDSCHELIHRMNKAYVKREQLQNELEIMAFEMGLLDLEGDE